MRNLLSGLLAIFILAVVSGDATGEERRADGGGPRFKGLFDAFDADGDGMLDAKEIDAASDRLRKFDKNDDGDVTQRDVFHEVGHFRVPSARPSAILFAALDPNGDRTIDRAELRLTPELLRKLDADQDGKIELREITR